MVGVQVRVVALASEDEQRSCACCSRVEVMGVEIEGKLVQHGGAENDGRGSMRGANGLACTRGSVGLCVRRGRGCVYVASQADTFRVRIAATPSRSPVAPSRAHVVFDDSEPPSLSCLATFPFSTSHAHPLPRAASARTAAHLAPASPPFIPHPFHAFFFAVADLCGLIRSSFIMMPTSLPFRETNICEKRQIANK